MFSEGTSGNRDVDPLPCIWSRFAVFYILGSCRVSFLADVSLAFEIGALIPFTPRNVAVLTSLALRLSPERQACEWYHWRFSGIL